MTHGYKKILFFVPVVLFLFTACKESGDGTPASDQNFYYINIGEFPTLNAVKNYRTGLSKEINDHANIQKISDHAYRLLVGKYGTSFQAGKEAYNYFSKNLIRDYSILKAGKNVLDEFRNILFVADFQGRPSVYQFDLLSKKSVIIWSRWGSKVASLNTTEDRKTAFITSVLSLGKRGGLPYLLDARIFLLNREKNEYYEKYQFGDGMQLYTYWENPDTFKVNLTSIDTVNSRIVYQKIFPFDRNGKAGSAVTREFDLVKNGFPLPPGRTPLYFSPNSRFQFRQTAFNNEYDIYLKDIQEKSEVLVATSSRKLADARWSEDGNYLFIVTVNVQTGIGKKKNEPSGELIVIDAQQKKQVNVFSGYRYKNILPHGNLLLFDERSNTSSKINILDFKRNEIIYTVTMPGGCGLNDLPL